jgi:hypothetical protein
VGKLKIVNQAIDKTIIKNTLIELGDVSIILVVLLHGVCYLGLREDPFLLLVSKQAHA